MNNIDSEMTKRSGWRMVICNSPARPLRLTCKITFSLAFGLVWLFIRSCFTRDKLLHGCYFYTAFQKAILGNGLLLNEF